MVLVVLYPIADTDNVGRLKGILDLDVVDECDEGWLGTGRRLNGGEELKADGLVEYGRQVALAQEKHN